MNDIYTSVAQDAWRNGRTTRMTEDAAKAEQRLEFLVGLMSKTLADAEGAEAYAKERRDEAEYLRAIIERERTDPTQVAPAADDGPETPTAPSAPGASGVRNGLLSGPYPRVPAAPPSPLDPPPAGRADDAAGGAPEGGGPWT